MEEQAVMIALRAGWAGFLGGVLSGAVIGLKFHNETWRAATAAASAGC